jgi:hypothetical protein
LGQASCRRLPTRATVPGEFIYHELFLAGEGVESSSSDKPRAWIQWRVDGPQPRDDDPELGSNQARDACFCSVDGEQCECGIRHGDDRPGTGSDLDLDE